MIPLAAGIMVFTISNRDLAAIDLWPLPIAFQAPVFSIALAGVFAGFIIGAIIAWISAGRTRTRNRQLMRQLENQARELAILKEQLKKAETQIASHPGTNLALPRRDADAA